MCVRARLWPWHLQNHSLNASVPPGGPGVITTGWFGRSRAVVSWQTCCLLPLLQSMTHRCIAVLPHTHAPMHPHLPQIKPHACESSFKGRGIVPERRTAVNSHPAPFGPRDTANKQTAARGKGWSHNLPLDWRQVSGNIVMIRYDATTLKERHPEFMVICPVLTCCVITFL